MSIKKFQMKDLLEQVALNEANKAVKEEEEMEEDEVEEEEDEIAEYAVGDIVEDDDGLVWELVG